MSLRALVRPRHPGERRGARHALRAGGGSRPVGRSQHHLTAAWRSPGRPP